MSTEQTHTKSDTSSPKRVLLVKDIDSPSSLIQPGMPRELSRHVGGPRSTVRASSVLQRKWETQAMDMMLHTREQANRARTPDHAKQKGAKSLTQATTDKIKHIKDDTNIKDALRQDGTSSNERAQGAAAVRTKRQIFQIKKGENWVRSPRCGLKYLGD